MEDACLREQLIAGFLHTPNTSIPVCLRMSRGIKVQHSVAAKCIKQLVADGFLLCTYRSGRLPPEYTVSRIGLELSRADEYLERPLSIYEEKTLFAAKKQEPRFAQDQMKVLLFFQTNAPLMLTTLMIQDVLRKSVHDDNLFYTETILSQLVWNNEIENVSHQSLWRFKCIATKHIWDEL